MREIMVTLRPESEAVGSGLGRSLMVGTLPPPKSKITMDAAKLRGPDASTVPASGRLTFQSADGTWKPAPAGTGVRGRIEGRGGWVRTVEDGRFTVEVPVNGRVSALVDHKESGWLSSTYATVAVDPSTSAGFHGGTEPVVSADRKVTLGGKLYAYDIPAPTKLKVVVEFRRKGTEEWVVKATRESAAPAGDSTRVVTVARLPYPGSGHWRLRYTGTPAIPAGYVATHAPLAYRTNTAIPEFNAAPEPVKAGRPITITGKLTMPLWYNENEWVGFASQPVRIYFRATGTTTWKSMGTATTASDGTFKKAFTAAKDGTWQARYEPGLETSFASTSREDLVDVQ
ncbi:hypothetical protein OG898_28455 [Streptomyces sp. NBC_00193]|uniref:hypothetical protein n=1 Tax=unclassified Streptomyces TaxID=2593676 RepID=UPI002258F7FC|nr:MULTISPECIES: hypothetical protein [unclassified Streptomyces]MCX5129963.1 hypothetical protein [Streptomyces sp. NBC_00347]MCX5300365.1 hypothetical protein [Streptomyces sp. NBC_00193]